MTHARRSSGFRIPHGIVTFLFTDIEGSTRLPQELGAAVSTGSRRVQIYCIAGIGCALLQQGDDRAAARLWGIAEDRERRLGFRMLLTERQRTSA